MILAFSSGFIILVLCVSNCQDGEFTHTSWRQGGLQNLMTMGSWEKDQMVEVTVPGWK